MDKANKKIEIAKLFFELNKVIQAVMRKNFESVGITLPQGVVIGTLLEGGAMKISDLSKKISLSNSTISGIVDRLEKQQIVTRIRGENDRRTVYVKLTPEFEETFRKNHQKATVCFAKSINSGTPEELEQITEALILLKKILVVNNNPGE